MKVAYFVILGSLIGLAAIETRAEEKSSSPLAEHRFVVSLPNWPLKQGERIVGFSLAVTSGRVHAIENIPNDWSVSLNTDIGWKPLVSGGCRHGAGALNSLDDIPSVTVEPFPVSPDQPPFWVDVTVDITVDFETVTTIEIPVTDL